MHRFASLSFKCCLPTLKRSVDGVQKLLASYIPHIYPGVVFAFNGNKGKWNHWWPQNTTVCLFYVAPGNMNPVSFP